MKGAMMLIFRLMCLALLWPSSEPARAGYVSPITISGGGSGSAAITGNPLIANVTVTATSNSPIVLNLPVSQNTSGNLYQLNFTSFANNTGATWSGFTFALTSGDARLATFQPGSFPFPFLNVSSPMPQIVLSQGTLASGNAFVGNLLFSSSGSGTIIITGTPSVGAGGPIVPEPASLIPMSFGIL